MNLILFPMPLLCLHIAGSDADLPKKADGEADAQGA